MRGGPMGGFNQRPAPYDRGDRFGGMNRFSNNGRGSRNRGTSSVLSKLLRELLLFIIKRKKRIFIIWIIY